MQTKPRVAVILEERFQRTPDGKMYSPSGFGDAIWDRYVRIFGPISIIARVEEILTPSEGSAAITDDRLTFQAIPSFIGAAQLALRLPFVMAAMARALESSDAYILRLPGSLGFFAEPHIIRSGKPFAVELVGDPRAVFNAGVGGLAGRMFGGLIIGSTRRTCSKAATVCYVTKNSLQRSYPPKPHAFSAAVSDVELSRENFVGSPRPVHSFARRPFRLLLVGTLEQRYKGVDVLIEAVASLIREGHDVALDIVGEGKFRAELEEQAERQGIFDAVTFHGRLLRDEVLHKMDICDLLVQPSRTEGLPRTIIEAFARATPVIATTVGGIPELVDQEYLVPPGDSTCLAKVIATCMHNPEQLSRMSVRNLEVSKSFLKEFLDRERSNFYEHFAEFLDLPH